MAKKKDFYNQSISGEDVELLAQFTGKLGQGSAQQESFISAEEEPEGDEGSSFEANASYLEGVSCRIEVSVEECVEEKLMLEETANICRIFLLESMRLSHASTSTR